MGARQVASTASIPRGDSRAAAPRDLASAALGDGPETYLRFHFVRKILHTHDCNSKRDSDFARFALARGVHCKRHTQVEKICFQIPPNLSSESTVSAPPRPIFGGIRMKYLLRVLFILALFCGFTSHARAVGVDFRVQVLDPANVCVSSPNPASCTIGDPTQPFAVTFDSQTCGLAQLPT